MLNLNCAEGMRCINLKEVQRVRFLNPRLDTELKRALEVLASSHDSLKKQVSPRAVAARRGKKVSDVLRRRGGEAAVTE